MAKWVQFQGILHFTVIFLCLNLNQAIFPPFEVWSENAVQPAVTGKHSHRQQLWIWLEVIQQEAWKVKHKVLSVPNRESVYSPLIQLLWVFLLQRNQISYLLPVHLSFTHKKTQVLIRDLEHKLRTSNMILQSDRGTKVNTFKSHLSMFDLPKWMCSLCLIALY